MITVTLRSSNKLCQIRITFCILQNLELRNNLQYWKLHRGNCIQHSLVSVNGFAYLFQCICCEYKKKKKILTMNFPMSFNMLWWLKGKMFDTPWTLPEICKNLNFSFIDASLEIISWLSMQGLDLSSDIYRIWKNQ